jgi:hypothetical protein
MRLRLKLHQAYVALMRQWPRSRWRLRLLGASGAWGVGSGRTRPGQGRVPGGFRAPIAKVGFGRKPALYPARAESRLFDMALKLSKMV